MKTIVMRRLCAIVIVIAVLSCGHKSGGFDPRDTVRVPEGLIGEDSIAYIENVVVQSPISAEDLLNLAEIHTFDEWVKEWIEYRRTEYESSQETTEIDFDITRFEEATAIRHRDSCDIQLANRFMRMHHLVDMNGDAMDKLQWAKAVNVIIDTFCTQVPILGRDSAIDDIMRIFAKFSPMNQFDMNLACYVMSSIDYYRTIDAYRQWLEDVPDNLRQLAKEEYQAWVELNEARFSLWRDVCFTQEWYSMKPMQIEGYYQHLSENRRFELDIERDIVLRGQTYKQKGKTVTLKQWEQWIKEHSVPEDYYEVMECYGTYDNMPSDSTINACTRAIRQTFNRWLVARHALAAALPKTQGTSYDNLTADMHSRIIGKLPPIEPLVGIYEED